MPRTHTDTIIDHLKVRGAGPFFARELADLLGIDISTTTSAMHRFWQIGVLERVPVKDRKKPISRPFCYRVVNLGKLPQKFLMPHEPPPRKERPMPATMPMRAMVNGPAHDYATHRHTTMHEKAQQLHEMALRLMAFAGELSPLLSAPPPSLKDYSEAALHQELLDRWTARHTDMADQANAPEDGSDTFG